MMERIGVKVRDILTARASCGGAGSASTAALLFGGARLLHRYLQELEQKPKVITERAGQKKQI